MIRTVASLIARAIHEFARYCEALEDLRVEKARRAR